MAKTQRGFDYEHNVAKTLKRYNLVQHNFRPAGNRSDQPDLMLNYRNEKQPYELKLKAASAGSLVLRWKDGSWGFDEDRDDPEKIFIQSLAKDINLLTILNKKWTATPYKRDRDHLWEATAGKISPSDRYKRDKDNFHELVGTIPPSAVESYYNRKNTYYINIGTHGFFQLGNRDPYNLKTLPTFRNSAVTQWRARVQAKEPTRYQFTFELAFWMNKKSVYNIGPVLGNGPKIDTSRLNLSVFKDL